ncbi:SAM-dependent methyltransferase [Alteribacter lacisalsi]|uniref:SAM-dependent methyltransferase n=1 Tax=Alteribacter lacisalsi TaxID=2045244 RepID=A0A2W0H9T2_9BACI|nr:SAM-dependent methyltransferase [Alteribacter lacisalsi]PYZ98614.1 SAM-dependent methyltransferase [Alteribacter lacisalsi]
MEAIHKLIRNSGRKQISFARFMEEALYHETEGYYTKEKTKIGTEGDFYTSSHVHPVFGWTFGQFFAGVLNTENIAPVICEWGAGDGRFAEAVLDYLQRSEPELYSDISYLVIEKSRSHREVMKDRLSDHRKHVRLFEDFVSCSEAVPVFEGVLFSNELLDAFPVHVLEKYGESYLEIFVTVGADNKLAEVKTVCDNTEILDLINMYGPELPDGHRTEVSPGVKRWVKSVSRWLRKGIAVTVDYGYTNEELAAPELKEGSVRGYRSHQIVPDPLLYPGKMDITAHVHWDALRALFLKEQFVEFINTRQGRFLHHAGIFDFLKQPEVTDGPFSETFRLNRAIQNLTSLSGTATAFWVNVQSRGLHRTGDWHFYREKEEKVPGRK